jgi:ABC-2 type transport system permease protein
MSRRLIWAILRKDALDLWLNKATLWGLVFPIALSLVWLLIGRGIGRSATLILVSDPDGSGVTEVVAAAFANTQVEPAASAAEVAAAFDEDSETAGQQYAVGLVVPAGFEEQLRAGTRPELELYFDGDEVNSRTQALVRAAIISYCRTLASPESPIELATNEVNESPERPLNLELANLYAPLALLVSLVVGTTFMPQLLIEEKEKKTLRMLMVTPASFEDVLFGKLLLVLAYQIILTLAAIAIQNAFVGQVGLVILYAVLGGLFSVSVGLLLGAAFNTVSAAAAIEGPLILIYILAGMFVGPLGELIRIGPFLYLVKLLPTYYIAHGLSNATQNAGTAGGHLLDIGVILVSTIVLFAISAWILRRQAAVAALI